MHDPFRSAPPAPVEPAPPPPPLIPRRAASAVVTTLIALVLLLRFDPGMQPKAHASTSAVTSPATGSINQTTGSNQQTVGSTDQAAGSANRTTGSGSNGSASTVVTGDAIGIRFGTVQVQVTVSNGQLVDVTALQLPSGGRDSQISAYAEPILRGEALQAGSASIDTVSGATYTSMGYIQSLQSALDQAGI